MSDIPDTLTIELDPPIEVKGAKYDTLNLREPRAGEMRKANGQMRSGVNAETLYMRAIHLVSMVSGWPVQAVEDLPDSKLKEAHDYLLGFSADNLLTGAA